MENKNYPEWVICYLNNELSSAERYDFEQQLATNSELRRELKLQKVISTELKTIALEELRISLAKGAVEYHQAKNSALPATNTKWLKWTVIIVAAILTLSGGYLIFHHYNISKSNDDDNMQKKETPIPNPLNKVEKIDSIAKAPSGSNVIAKKEQTIKTTTNTQLAITEITKEYQDFFKQEFESEISASKSAEPTNINMQTKLLRLFENAQYEECIQQGNLVGKNAPNYLSITEIIGQAALQLGDFPLAVSKFEFLVQVQQTGFSDRSKGPLLVAYLGAGKFNTPICKKLIDELDTSIYPEYSTLIKKLKDLDAKF